MLKTRVITAVLMLAAFVPSLFFMSQQVWAIFAACLAGIAAWEWGGFMQASGRMRIFFGLILCGLCLLWLLLLPETLAVGSSFSPGGSLTLHVLSLAFWLALAPFWLRCKWRLSGTWAGLIVGLIVLFPTWLALVQLRVLGAWPLLAILAVVWVADIAAYVFGRLFGRHKLALTISPGKTWEGAIGGGVAVLAYGVVMRHVFALDNTPLWLWGVGLLGVTMLSIVGDLFESLLKRQVGLKDSSQVLPGHGGVLDRIDSLTSTLPLVALLWLLVAPR